MPMPKGPRSPHRSEARYQRGCHCDDCKIAHSEYRQERRDDGKGTSA